MNFFTELISTNSPKSGKNFVALCSFFILAVACIANIFWKLTLADTYFFGLIGLITSCYGIGAYTNVKSMGVKGDVASDMVKSEPKAESAQNAKDILNSPKP